MILVVTALRDLENLDLRNQIKALRESGVAAGAQSVAELEEEDFFA